MFNTWARLMRTIKNCMRKASGDMSLCGTTETTTKKPLLQYLALKCTYAFVNDFNVYYTCMSLQCQFAHVV